MKTYKKFGYYLIFLILKKKKIYYHKFETKFLFKNTYHFIKQYLKKQF